VAVLGALRALAEGPLLLAVDDVQWLDAPSAAALAFALRRLRDEPVGIVVSASPTRCSPPACAKRPPPIGDGRHTVAWRSS
jgi:predicted ATPase